MGGKKRDAMEWGLTEVTPGFIAAAAVYVRIDTYSMHHSRLHHSSAPLRSINRYRIPSARREFSDSI
jgi:hypothetical protein